MVTKNRYEPKSSKSFQEYQKTFLNKPSKTIVLSDVDGTIIKGSLVLEHATLLHRKGVIDLGDLVEQWINDTKNEDLIFRLAVGYKQALVGKKVSELFVNDFVRNMISTEGKMYSTLDRLKKHHAIGHQVVLISGSPNFLVKPFAKHFGFFGIGSVYHRTKSHHLTGEVSGMFAASQKQQAVNKLNVSGYKNVIGYGDTASDAPLLTAAHHSVVVDPNKETLRNLKEVKISEVLRK